MRIFFITFTVVNHATLWLISLNDVCWFVHLLILI